MPPAIFNYSLSGIHHSAECRFMRLPNLGAAKHGHFAAPATRVCNTVQFLNSLANIYFQEKTVPYEKSCSHTAVPDQPSIGVARQGGNEDERGHAMRETQPDIVSVTLDEEDRLSHAPPILFGRHPHRRVIRDCAAPPRRRMCIGTSGKS